MNFFGNLNVQMYLCNAFDTAVRLCRQTIMKAYKIGIDIGSTTIKMAVLDKAGRLVEGLYRRHQMKINESFSAILEELKGLIGDAKVAISMTGSVGMGVSERMGLPFVQEVVATACYLRTHHPKVNTMIDIGGEDAKMVFVSDGTPDDLRMNGNCAGGTGAFIDQMAALLNTTPENLGRMAEQSARLYPIASRCGVFCKTDIQNLIARNVAREDIAASIFHAVAVQTMITLAHGRDIEAPVLLCGGPLTFIPAQRKAFAEHLGMPGEAFVVPEKAYLLPAWGTALSADEYVTTIDELIALASMKSSVRQKSADNLTPIFESEEQYSRWKKEKEGKGLQCQPLTAGRHEAYIGIDSGSTTTKIAVITADHKLLFSFYKNNNGNPIHTVEEGLQQLQAKCKESGTELIIKGSCSTGYGEDLIKAAFGMTGGIVETMAHYVAARHLNPHVSFILDIGGQDMKAMFASHNALQRIEVNEACSSGCGSFISTFAHSLNCEIGDFAHAACLAEHPYDLGTRCTVFMNSKVKQALREGASMADIAAGLSYSVVKNCLFKVLKLKSTAELGDNIVVQGGTMRNDSVVRALELLTGRSVTRSNMPELMGAVGCALHAMSAYKSSETTIEQMLAGISFQVKQQQCRGCQNQCAITRYRFEGGSTYYSGNRCEKIFTNGGSPKSHGRNVYERKLQLLFDRPSAETPAQGITIGIPRMLNMYEEYPFWHALFTSCGINVCLSAASEYKHYERCASKVMADNICFPAKLVHSHIDNLLSQGVDRIFMPFVVFEKKDSTMQNSFNCPIVTGYSQVIKSVQEGCAPIDSPSISFKDKKALHRQCTEYLTCLGVSRHTADKAFAEATLEQEQFEHDIADYNRELLREARANGRLVIMLAGRPYHSDPLIQHKVSEMIAAQGAYVLSDDMMRGDDTQLDGNNYLSQWAFTNRIMKTAAWCAKEDADIQMMELTSFGCGPDSFVIDEVARLLDMGGKSLTLLKIDDVNNIGSLKLRVRSFIESLTATHTDNKRQKAATASVPAYTKEHRHRKILFPFFTPFISPLLPSLVRYAGYDAEALPMSDQESADWGLQSANNEVCYPATLIIGDFIKALKSGKYNPDEVCLAMTQTGGQCRASNYIPLIRKALVDHGFTNTPVISLSVGSGIATDQPGFKVNWLKVVPMALDAIIFSDSMAKLYNATIVRCDDASAVDRLKESFMSRACTMIEHGHRSRLYELLDEAVSAFDAVCKEKDCKQVGIVGEIFLKFHPFAQKNITQWLRAKGIEVVYPLLTDFFLQSLPNIIENKRIGLEKTLMPDFIVRQLHSIVQSRLEKANAVCRRFRYFPLFDNIFDKAREAMRSITLSAQFGEGWLIAGEVGAMAKQGVTHVVSLQPFGCIANQIVEKGIENRLKRNYPEVKILSLDFDNSVSDVNIINRLLLFINDLLEQNIA